VTTQYDDHGNPIILSEDEYASLSSEDKAEYRYAICMAWCHAFGDELCTEHCAVGMEVISGK